MFKVAAVTAAAGTTIGSVASCMVGLNVTGSNLAGNVNTGNSSNAIVPSVAVENTASLPLRIVDIVPDTAISTTTTYTSIAGSVTITCAAIPSALVVGTEVGYIASNGQYVGTGSYIAAAAAAGATTVVLNSAPVTVNSPTGTASSTMTIPASSTLVFTQYPEAVVKFNFGIQEYYNTAGQASTL